jgi:hypothetical protein
MLHAIEPCSKPLAHPHPWPSAVAVLSGSYEMGVSESKGNNIAVMRLQAGSQYVMTNPAGWHYVSPIKKPSLSVMITGRPFSPDVKEVANHTPSKKLAPLSPWAKFHLWDQFCQLLNVDVGIKKVSFLKQLED